MLLKSPAFNQSPFKDSLGSVKTHVVPITEHSVLSYGPPPGRRRPMGLDRPDP